MASQTFAADDYYRVLRKHEAVRGRAPLGARTQLLVDSDLEAELLALSSEEDAPRQRRSNPVRDFYASLAKVGRQQQGPTGKPPPSSELCWVRPLCT